MCHAKLSEGLWSLQDVRSLKPYLKVLHCASREEKWNCLKSERSSAMSAGTHGACRMERADLWNAPNARVDLSAALKMMEAFGKGEETAKGNNAAAAGREGSSLAGFRLSWSHARAVRLVLAARMSFAHLWHQH